MNNYKGIIFDFNGTLFFDNEKVEESWIIYGLKLRKNILTKEELRTKVHGIPNKYIMEYLTGRKIEGQELLDRIKDKEEIYRNLCRKDIDNIALSPGAVPLLEYLVKNKIPHTIATSSEKTNVDFFIDIFKLKKWFDPDKIILDDHTFPGKPEPDIYIKAAEKLGLKPEECIVIEDAEAGLISAVRAKIGLVIAIGPKENHIHLKNISGVDKIITDLTGIDWKKYF
jgi:HAD superfamily hydrolase (TIGR01509 family)